MRVWDTQNAIGEALRALPWRQYMGAIWMLGAELQVLYAGQLTEAESALATETLVIVRDVSMSGETAAHERQTAELAARWARVIAEGEQRASGGLLNAWMTFEGAAAEIAGTSTHFYAADWVVGAATRRWRDASRRRRVDPQEQVPDDSPIAQTLVTFRQMVDAAGRAPNSSVDPAVLRQQVHRKAS